MGEIVKVKYDISLYRLLISIGKKSPIECMQRKSSYRRLPEASISLISLPRALRRE